MNTVIKKQLQTVVLGPSNFLEVQLRLLLLSLPDLFVSNMNVFTRYISFCRSALQKKGPFPPGDMLREINGASSKTFLCNIKLAKSFLILSCDGVSVLWVLSYSLLSRILVWVHLSVVDLTESALTVLCVINNTLNHKTYHKSVLILKKRNPKMDQEKHKDMQYSYLVEIQIHGSLNI